MDPKSRVQILDEAVSVSIHTNAPRKDRDPLVSPALYMGKSSGKLGFLGTLELLKAQLCADTGCSPEDLPGAMDDREGWRERDRVIHVNGAT